MAFSDVDQRSDFAQNSGFDRLHLLLEPRSACSRKTARRH